MTSIKSALAARLPAGIKTRLRVLKMRLSGERRFSGMKSAEIFDEIYQTGIWGTDENNVPTSGSGSHDQTVVAPYVAAVSQFLSSGNFDTLVDLGCGDFNVGSNFAGLCRSYIACDISNVVLERNRGKFDFPNVEFRQLSLAGGALPRGDVGFVRQVLQHISNAEIAAFVKQVNAGKPFRYLIVTEHLPRPNPDFCPNLDKPTGANIRIALNSGIELHKPPFGLDYKTMRVICEVVEDTGGRDAIIRSTLYEL